MWDTLVVTPLLNFLALVYGILPWHSFGLALLIVVVLFRLAMLSFTKKSFLMSRQQRELQPEIAKIKKANKGNRQQEALAIMALYKEHNVKPFKTILYFLAQIPIFIALWHMIRNIAENSAVILERSYGFVKQTPRLQDLEQNLELFDTTFFNLFDLTSQAFKNGEFVFSLVILAALTAGVQYLNSRQLFAHDDNVKHKSLGEIWKLQAAGKEVDSVEIGAAVSKAMIKVLPVVVFVASLFWLAALPFYWLVGGIIQYLQQHRLLKQTQTTVEGDLKGDKITGTLKLNAKQKRMGDQVKRPHSSNNNRKRVNAEVIKTTRKAKQQKGKKR